MLNGLSYFYISLLAKPSDPIKMSFQKPQDFLSCHNPKNSNRSMKQIQKVEVFLLLLTSSLINSSAMGSFYRISVTSYVSPFPSHHLFLSLSFPP